MNKEELQIFRGKLNSCSYIIKELIEYFNEFTNSYTYDDVTAKFASERALQKAEDIDDVLDNLDEIIETEISKADEKVEDKYNSE